jgi:uncharacterized protein (TIGR00295 family)
MNSVPTPEECLRILAEEGCSEDVIKHSEKVAEIAVKIAERIPDADIELVRIGGLLHDIGRAKTHDHLHISKGAEIAEARGLSPIIVEIIRKHVGAGLTDKEAKELGLPEGDYMPVTLEQKIVAHSDNLLDNQTPVTIKVFIKKLASRGLSSAIERVKKLHDELSNLAGIDLDKLILEARD